jgi:hypothetical protein
VELLDVLPYSKEEDEQKIWAFWWAAGCYGLSWTKRGEKLSSLLKHFLFCLFYFKTTNGFEHKRYKRKDRRKYI